MGTFKLALLTLVASAISAQAGSNPVWYNTGLGNTNKTHYKVGGDNVKFGWRMATGCDLESLKTAALKTKNQATTFAWDDDSWFGVGVPSGRCMVASWYDLTSSKYGWAAIQNKPGSWGVRSNSKNWVDIGNGVQKKYSYNINGQTVDIDIFNPYNQGTLTANDILFGFGW